MTINRTNTGGWKKYVFNVSDAKFANRQQSSCDFRLYDHGTTLYVDSAYLWCRKESAGLVTIHGNEFRTNGTRFYLVGANYVAPWMTGGWEQMWDNNYNSTTWSEIWRRWSLRE